jgi:hypothetical protein
MFSRHLLQNSHSYKWCAKSYNYKKSKIARKILERIIQNSTILLVKWPSASVLDKYLIIYAMKYTEMLDTNENKSNAILYKNMDEPHKQY